MYQHLQILDYCSLIEHPESSEAIAYVRKTLRELSNKEQLPGQVRAYIRLFVGFDPL